MIDLFNRASAIAMAEILGEPMEEHYSPDGWPTHAGPTIQIIDEPEQEIDDVIAALDDPDPYARRITRRLQLQKRAGPTLGKDEEGNYTFNSRICCFILLTEIDRRLHQLPAYSEHTCPGCGTKYGVGTAIRESRDARRA